MGVFGRSVFAFGVITVTATTGLVMAQVSDFLLTYDDGGPFRELMEQLQTLWPILFSVIILGVAAYVLLGGVQRERSVERRGRR
jgi:hypothetical protein